jgi:WD40 repeat protein
VTAVVSFDVTNAYMFTAGASVDGKWICAQLDSSFTLRDAAANKEVAKIEPEHGSITAHPCKVSNDGKFVATGGEHSLRVWNVAKKTQTKVADGNYEDAAMFGFHDGDDAVVHGSTPTSWDPATETATELAPSMRWAIATSKSRGAYAIAHLQAVHVVFTHGEAPPVDTCKHASHMGTLAFSHDGKSLACALQDGSVHIVDTTTWNERGADKVATEWDNVALRFTDDDKTLKALSNTQLVTFDASTAVATKVNLKHPNKKLVGSSPSEPHASRQPRIFDDGTFVVHPWLGGVALYDASGAYMRDLVIPKVDSPDAFSHDGKTFAERTKDGIVVMDVATGIQRAVPIANVSGNLAMTPDAGSIVLFRYGGNVVVTGTDARAFDGGVYTIGDDAVLDPAFALAGFGVVATLPTGAFEVSRDADVVCEVGTITLERSTCDDRAQSGLLATALPL